MRREILEKLSIITQEEQEILDGNQVIQKDLYATEKAFVIRSEKMMEKGRLIEIRPHTRFAYFPKHRHDYIEIIYMCTGTTTHIINDGKKVVLNEGELLFLSQNAYHEILPAKEEDIAVNFIVLPEFFDVALEMLGDDNIIGEFVADSLRSGNGSTEYLHFQVADVITVQNLVENMVWSILYKQPNRRKINQATMGLLFVQLLNYTERIVRNEDKQYESGLVLSVIRYIEENYRTASLTEVCGQLNQSMGRLSKLIKAQSGSTYQELLQNKRLNKAAELLERTKLSIADIIYQVGYDNSSYFYRLFKERFLMSPKEYRQLHNGK
ncbi:MAG: helix-turn-helix domain-containing protein [Lachnospiraceae bacterium]|nr:helix-turn-helix domain-containing protein [Lachnospiraceae bacterium]